MLYQFKHNNKSYHQFNKHNKLVLKNLSKELVKKKILKNIKKLLTKDFSYGKLEILRILLIIMMINIVLIKKKKKVLVKMMIKILLLID